MKKLSHRRFYRTNNLVGMLGLIAVMSSTSAMAQTYSYQQLGTLSAASGFNVGSVANGLNATGAIAGASSDSTGNSRATSTVGGTVVNFGTLGGTTSTANAVNAAGTYVGNANTTGDAASNAFLYTTAGGIKSLGTLNGGSTDNSSASAINTAGEIVGQSANSSIGGVPLHAYAFYSSTPTVPPVTAKDTQMKDLGSLMGVGGNSNAFGVNTSGTVVGSSDTATGTAAFICTTDTSTGSVVITNGGMKTLGQGTLGGSFGTASAINAGGVVVGDSTISGDALDQAFYATAVGGVYTMVNIQNLGPLSLGANGAAVSVNSAGKAVGYFAAADFSNSRAFSYTVGGGMVDLNSLVSPASLGGFTLTSATGINDLGQISGIATNSAGVQMGFLLSPTPEPAPLAVLALGMAGLAGLSLRARRRSASLSL